VHIIGDVEGKDVLIVDDLIDTAGTFVGAIEALKKNGAVNLWSNYASASFRSCN
jgi:ribose-phosphate pyrophosphokinase